MFVWLKQPPRELVLAHTMCRGRFHYQNQPNEWNNGRVYSVYDFHTVQSRAWFGDCDDWAATMVNELGREATYIEFYLPDGRYHAACLYKGWVSDCLRREVYQMGKIRIKLQVSYDVLLQYGKKY